jgi:hypothetical protein
VALIADTFNVDELPAVIEAGLAVMLTVRTGFELWVKMPPHPVTSMANESPKNRVAKKRV